MRMDVAEDIDMEGLKSTRMDIIGGSTIMEQIPSTRMVILAPGQCQYWDQPVISRSLC